MLRLQDLGSQHSTVFGWKREGSPLWRRALERYWEELEEKDAFAFQDIIEVGSLQDLLESAKAIEPLLPPERGALAAMHRLGPTLKFFDDFSAVLAFYFGADAKLTAFVWGSIRLMLNQAASAADTLKDVLDMIEELSFTLPRLSACEDNIQNDRGLETAILDVYTEVICFYARCIHFLRTHPHVLLRRAAWEDFRSDFTRTLRRIRRLSSTVETEAEAARMKHECVKYAEVLQVMEALKGSKLQDRETSTNVHYLPSQLSPRFHGREAVFHQMDKILLPSMKSNGLRSFALHGLGGVGKTQIALHYANKSREDYSHILWVAADNVISVGQSFRDIAQMMGFVSNEQELQDTIALTLKVRNWLNDTSTHWMLIFDNADDLEVLRHVWPAMGKGSVIITTRDASAAHSPATAGLDVKAFNDSVGCTMLLDILGLDKVSSANRTTARAISSTLGGLPLALAQIGGFIAQRKLPLSDFLSLYERKASNIDARKTGISDYEHTLSTVWELSMSRLSGDAQTLLNLLSYLQPDSINEDIFSKGSATVDEVDFAFLDDEIDFGDAEEPLMKTSLLEKDQESGVLSMHRLVQVAVIRKQTDADRARYLHIAVRILAQGFPDTWNQDIGHQISSWWMCEKCLPHVHHIVELRTRQSIRLEDPQAYAELLLRCSWYLYEREMYDMAQSMVIAAIDTFEDKSTLAYASAIDLKGLIMLDQSDPEGALTPFTEALNIRKACLGDSDPMIASSLNNIALSYTEMRRLDEAHSVHEQAIKIRLNDNSDRIGNSYSNMSSLLLRMGRPDEAEEMLKRCPSLKDFTDDTFLKTGNPRFSGDMVLLSRIRRQQGRLDDAVRLASKALAFRQKLLGNRLKVCDSMYDVASFLKEEGNSASAIELLQQLVEIASSIPEGKGQNARACYKLTCLYADKGMAERSAEWKSEAMSLRAELCPSAATAPFEEDSFNDLCLWMLW